MRQIPGVGGIRLHIGFLRRMLQSGIPALSIPSISISLLSCRARSKERLSWLQDGADFEDNGIRIPLTPFEIPDRSLNHFHDPTKPLANAGLHDFFSGMSALLWSQSPEAQSPKTEHDWSWQKVREHEYNYLTNKEQSDRDAFQALMLKGLGFRCTWYRICRSPTMSETTPIYLTGWG